MHSSEALDLTQEPLAASLLTAEQKERLTDVLDRYLSSLEAGAPIDPDSLVRDHPDLAEPLREYLRSLDELHGAAAGFGNGGCDSTVAPMEGNTKRLGDFVLGRELGRGGMGVVYEARQLSLDRRVALKVLPFAAVLDSKQIARFKTEAQVAAQILHPNIVPIFAIGIDRGVHFYAMQLVDGQPLDRAIAELSESRRTQSRPIRLREEELRVDERAVTSTEPAFCDTLDLDCEATRGSMLSSRDHTSQDYFRTIARLGVQAAEALHAAHEHGIVHRDVKPSNLLLDADGKLWVTDFGLARCQRDVTFSKTGDVVGTMRYMSPEQASGKTSLIDQRTDVYSLGVTLYELLTLRPALQGEDGPDLLRKLDSTEPTPPRKLNAAIPVGLENVILKAVAKTREDRYTTAANFANDLRRFLEGKPTIAKPPTAVERVYKWATRHRRVVASALSVSLLACCGFALSTILIAREKVKAEQNFERAERNLDEAQKAVERFGSQFAERLAGIPAAARVRRDMLRETLESYQQFAEQAAEDASLQGDLAVTYSKIGSVTDRMGSTAEAITAHEKAIALFEKLVAAEPRDLEHRQRLALCQNNLALTLQRAGRVDEAKRRFTEAIELQTELVRRSADDSFVGDLAITRTNLGLLLSETDAKREAERSFREAIRLQEQLADASPDDVQRRHHLAATYNNLSAVYAGSDPEKSEHCYRSAVNHLGQAIAAEPGNPEFASRLASTYSNLGVLQSQQKRYRAAADSLERAIDLQEALVNAARYRHTYRRDLALTYNTHGLVLSRLRRTADAEQAFRKTLTIHQALAALDPNDIAVRSSCGGVWNNLGIVLEGQRRFEDAAAAYQNAITQQEYAHSRVPSVTRYRRFLSKHYYNLGRVFRELGRGEQAVEAALERRELWWNEPDRLFSVAEEIALAAPLVANSDRTVTLAFETLDQAVAAGGKLPADFAEREAAAVLRDSIDRLSQPINEHLRQLFYNKEQYHEEED